MKNSIQNLFLNTRFEIFLVIAVFISVLLAFYSILEFQRWIELGNLLFSCFFIAELSLRFWVCEDKPRYFRTFWLDWIASIPWDLFFLLIFPVQLLNLTWLRLLRLPRIIRVLRFISMGRSNLGSRFIYQVKKILEKSLPRQLTILTVTTFIFLVLFGFFFQHLQADDSEYEPYYFSLITLMSSDSIFEVGNESGIYQFLTVVLAFFGIVLFNGILIAVIVSRLNEYLEDVRQGRGRVSEKNHIIILGWIGLITDILQELDIYSKNERTSLKVVILVQNFDSSMIQTIKGYRYVDVVLRRGKSFKVDHLQDISIQKSRNILFLGEYTSIFNGDILQESALIKSFLTVQRIFHSPDGKTNKIQKTPSLLLNIRQRLFDTLLEPLSPNLSITAFDPFFYSAKILTSALLDPRIYPILSEIFSFQGAEFYFCKYSDPEIQFIDLVNRVSNCIVLGIKRNSSIHLIPDSTMTIYPGDTIIALGESFHRVQKELHKKQRKISLPNLTESVLINNQEFQGFYTAIIGINPKLPFLIDELGKIGCKILVIDDQPTREFAIWYGEQTGKKIPEFVEYRYFIFADQDTLDSDFPIQTLQKILVLADESVGNNNPELVDADTIFKLLKIQKLIQNLSNIDTKPVVVAEILSADSDLAVQNLPNVHAIMGTSILAKIVSSYLVEPSVEHVVKNIIQRGGYDIEIRSLNSEITSLNFGQISIFGLNHGYLVLGILRNGKHVLNPPHNLELSITDNLIVLLKAID